MSATIVLAGNSTGPFDLAALLRVASAAPDPDRLAAMLVEREAQRRHAALVASIPFERCSDFCDYGCTHGGDP